MGASQGLGPPQSRESEGETLPHINLGPKGFAPNVKLIYKHCFVGTRGKMETKRNAGKSSLNRCCPWPTFQQICSLEISENFKFYVRLRMPFTGLTHMHYWEAHVNLVEGAFILASKNILFQVQLQYAGKSNKAHKEIGHYKPESTEKADSRNRHASDIEIIRYSLWSNYTYYVLKSKRHT